MLYLCTRFHTKSDAEHKFFEKLTQARSSAARTWPDANLEIKELYSVEFDPGSG